MVEVEGYLAGECSVTSKNLPGHCGVRKIFAREKVYIKFGWIDT